MEKNENVLKFIEYATLKINFTNNRFLKNSSSSASKVKRMVINDESDDNVSVKNNMGENQESAKSKSKTSKLKKFNVFKKNDDNNAGGHTAQIALNQQMLDLNEQQILLLQQQAQGSPIILPTTFGNYNDNNYNHEDIIVPTVGKIRDEWTNKIEYLLSVIGYVVDLGNCIRFPYICYKNGGGAFLIPYFIFLFLIGIPMMYLEMSIGQFFRVGNITLWGKVNIFMKGNL